MCTNGAIAISCYSYNGPTFGLDLYIASGSNWNQDSFSGFGRSYKHPDYQFGRVKTASILAGSYHFQTLEIEVFTQTN